MSLISPVAQAIIDRINAVDQTLPYRLDTAKVEGALMAHLKALKQPERPVRWVMGAKAGFIDIAKKADAAWDVAWNAARNAAWDAAWNAALGAAWDAAWDAAWNAAWNAARNAARGAAWNAALGAAWDAAWDVAWGAARGAAVVNATYNHPRYQEFLQTWMPFLQAHEGGLGIFWVREQEILATPRPIFKFRDGRLHGDGEPSIRWPDGEAYYFFRGVMIPADWGKVKTEAWQSSWLIDTKNAEQRRVLLQGIGYDRVMRDLKFDLVHRQGDMELRKKSGIDVEPVMLLKVVCPSTRQPYVLRVPPTMTECEKARRWSLHDDDATLDLLAET
jgi:hypothetical protein